MKQSIFFLTLLLFAIVSFGQVHVKGYTKSNGTYVQPYTRSSPDGNPYNNYSYPGNTNPYTGKVATGNPDTYLNNYYNRSSIGSSNIIDTKIYLKKNNSVNKGRYLKSFYKSSEYTVYDIYNDGNIYDGYLTYFNSGVIRIYDKNKIFIKEVTISTVGNDYDFNFDNIITGSNNSYLTYFNSGVIRIYDKNKIFIKEVTISTVGNDYDFNFDNIITGSNNSTRITVPPKVLIKDKFYKEGDYFTKTLSDYGLNAMYNHYNSLGEYLGFYSISFDGEVFGYDRNYNKIMHKKHTKEQDR